LLSKSSLVRSLFNINLIAALNNTQTILVIYFADDTLDKMAEILEVPVRLLDIGQCVEFKNHAEDMFE
jgi:hypothetical protein